MSLATWPRSGTDVDTSVWYGGVGGDIPQEQLFAKYRVTLRFISDNLMKFLWNLSLEISSTLLKFRCINDDSWQHYLMWHSTSFNHRMCV